MHVIIFRVIAALIFLFILATILGACARPVERNIWREMYEAGDLGP